VGRTSRRAEADKKAGLTPIVGLLGAVEKRQNWSRIPLCSRARREYSSARPNPFPQKDGKTEMRSFKLIPSAALALLALVFLTPATSAHAQGPAYLHALSDLRSARAYLQYDNRPAQAGARAFAIQQIDHAINDVKVAAVDDGKNPWHTPPPQSGGSGLWPIHSAFKLLKEARSDVDHGQDLPQNHGLRERATGHIDEALAALKPLM